MTKKEQIDQVKKELFDLSEKKMVEGIEKYGEGDIEDPIYEMKCEVADLINYMSDVIFKLENRAVIGNTKIIYIKDRGLE